MKLAKTNSLCTADVFAVFAIITLIGFLAIILFALWITHNPTINPDLPEEAYMLVNRLIISLATTLLVCLIILKNFGKEIEHQLWEDDNGNLIRMVEKETSGDRRTGETALTSSKFAITFVMVKQHPLDSIFNCGTLVIHFKDNNYPYVMSGVSNPKELSDWLMEKYSVKN